MSEYIVKFDKGYLFCPPICWPHLGELVPTPAQAAVFKTQGKAMQALDTYKSYFGKGTVLEGQTVGHIIHKINLAEGNYVTCQSVSKLYGRD